MVLNSALDSVSSISNTPIDDSDITAHVIVSGCMCINKTEREQSTIEYAEGDTTISNIDVTEYIIEKEEDNENVKEATDSINVDGDAENFVTYHRILNREHADENNYAEKIFDKGTESDYIESSEEDWVSRCKNVIKTESNYLQNEQLIDVRTEKLIISVNVEDSDSNFGIEF
ncbi:hypothetical protein FQA39_LY09647 [Lamprigera yunnana]|nr:hypothetical protein FQA39_LY09647 [Lamprigera yunnana]